MRMIFTLAALLLVQPAYAEEHDHGHAHEEHEEGAIELTAAQIETAGIVVAPAGSGTIAKEIAVPGKIVAAADRMAQIVPKVDGIVVQAPKNLGDTVEKGEVLAVIESRDMAETVADYLAARRAEELARTMYEREKTLWEKKITAEQDYLNAKNKHQEAKIHFDLTRQKLQALGHDEQTLKTYDSVEAADKLRFHEIRAPIAGRVIAREVTLGEYVDSTHITFAVADLSTVWVETAIAPGDLSFVREGQNANVSGGARKTAGKIIFISPVIDPQTRAATAIIELENKDGAWRAGEFVQAAIATSSIDAGLTIPKDAVQKMGGEDAVFVKTDHGFEKRAVKLGREDSGNVEILEGLKAGEPIAVKNTFTLKAELGKAEAGHDHAH